MCYLTKLRSPIDYERRKGAVKYENRLVLLLLDYDVNTQNQQMCKIFFVRAGKPHDFHVIVARRLRIASAWLSVAHAQSTLPYITDTASNRTKYLDCVNELST